MQCKSSLQFSIKKIIRIDFLRTLNLTNSQLTTSKALNNWALTLFCCNSDPYLYCLLHHICSKNKHFLLQNPVEGGVLPTVNSVSLHTIFHFQPFIGTILLKHIVERAVLSQLIHSFTHEAKSSLNSPFLHNNFTQNETSNQRSLKKCTRQFIINLYQINFHNEIGLPQKTVPDQGPRL